MKKNQIEKEKIRERIIIDILQKTGLLIGPETSTDDVFELYVEMMKAKKRHEKIKVLAKKRI